jgi:hypothetical protein
MSGNGRLDYALERTALAAEGEIDRLGETPASSATAAIVVPAYPRSTKRRKPASRIRRRVCSA